MRGIFGHISETQISDLLNQSRRMSRSSLGAVRGNIADVQKKRLISGCILQHCQCALGNVGALVAVQFLRHAILMVSVR